MYTEPEELFNKFEEGSPDGLPQPKRGPIHQHCLSVAFQHRCKAGKSTSHIYLAYLYVWFTMPCPTCTAPFYTNAFQHSFFTETLVHTWTSGHSPPFAPIHALCSSSSSCHSSGASSFPRPDTVAVSPQTIPHSTTYSSQHFSSSCSFSG